MNWQRAFFDWTLNEGTELYAEWCIQEENRRRAYYSFLATFGDSA